ncbi:DUF3226 domain-containing protein [Ferruginibacter sp.]
MINLLNFAVEGNDIKFIHDYILFLKLKIETLTQTPTGGWTNLHLVSNKFQEVSDKQGQNIVIFDADEDAEQRKLDLQRRAAELNIQFDLFLFPDNTSSGEIEDLLLKIINPKYSDFTDCFDGYIECINNCENPVHAKIMKSKIFAYLECTNQQTNLTKVDFLNTEYWDLNNPALNPLKVFLLKQETILNGNA